LEDYSPRTDGRTDGQTDGRRDPISWSRCLITTPSGFDNLLNLLILKTCYLILATSKRIEDKRSRI